ncbi:MAG: protein-L-isoaspartate(D-aspartate) O-methyltransferase [Proteobacteria bacterium]|nr:protein-L-isoaspartate(D-aspartate) O-methyltransferase [Pseudomonadota bacterium]
MLSPEAQMQFLLMLRNKGIADKILAAMEKVPRDEFVDGHFKPHALDDMALPIDAGQTISQPSVVAKMSEALDVGPRHKVLEVGTGSGYQAAILSHLARRVYSVERHRVLSIKARARIEALKLQNVVITTADGSLGMPDQAPFDRIILTAAAEDPPANLLEQLRMGGIMVLPVGQAEAVQSLIKVEKTPEGLNYTELAEVRFVPLLAGIAKPDGA